MGPDHVSGQVLDPNLPLVSNLTHSSGPVFVKLDNSRSTIHKQTGVDPAASSDIGGRLWSPIQKQILKYYRRTKEPRGKPVTDSLILEAVEAIGDPSVQFQSFVGLVNQLSSEAAKSLVCLKVESVSSLGAIPASKPGLLW
jgi:hypothetical protein